MPTAGPPYVELQTTSNFSFLRGASHPEELARTAAALGHAAAAIADRNSLAGVVRAHVAARAAGTRLVVGARLDLTDGPSLLCFPTDRAAYARLSRLLTLGKRRAPKGDCHLGRADLFAHAEGQIFVLLPPTAPAAPDAGFAATLAEMRAGLGRDCFLAAQYLYAGADAARIARLAALAAAAGTPLVATNDARMHAAERRPLLDVLTCIRARCTIDTAGRRLAANAERHLKPPAEMARLFAAWPEAVARAAEIAGRCRFSLDDLRYDYPTDPAPGGGDPQTALERLTWEGAEERYSNKIPDKVTEMLEYELGLISELGYAPYFLTVHDIVRFARGRGILCQGRGSAANSAVCYCLGITAVDPARMDMLFERFISTERDEPPDIDVDFEHERREEVIQYIYAKYGRERAGLAATVISYRARSALRETGKAMGLSGDTLDALSRANWGRRSRLEKDTMREAGLDPADRRVRLTLTLARQIMGFPRHLSQHVGGFVITRGPLSELSPIANAAMEDRTVIEWDKDDLDALGILKIDVLGLGMLTCIRKAFDLIAAHHGRRLDLAGVPAEDPAVYDMLCDGDSVGVFQVESRAQMSMLPRLKPRCFYDLVIEVAIVRPGPIQGDMVHPYLRRRRGEEPVSYPSEELRGVLGKTLGVPLFQEQAMRIAIVAGGFSPAEADKLRRAMATFRRTGQVSAFRARMVAGMLERGYARDFAEHCFSQIEGFGEYGFPESHAASFALLVYVSAWLKRHYPAAFACALLNSQPMGFYAPAQLVRDARDHGVCVRAPDVNRSDWDCALEPETPGAPGAVALRLGLRQVKGLSEEAARRLTAARGAGYGDPAALWRRAGLAPAVLETLARADAFAGMGLDRRQALWAVRGLGAAPLPLFAAAEDRAREAADSAPVTGGGQETEAPGPFAEPPARLPEMGTGEAVMADYGALRLSLRAHPLALLRDGLAARGYIPAARLAETAPGRRVRLAGLVTARQRPGTASGTIFVTLEDETGTANLIVWPRVFEAFRRPLLGAVLLGTAGKLEREGKVIHVIVDTPEDLSPLLVGLAEPAAPGKRAPRLHPRFPSRNFQ